MLKTAPLLGLRPILLTEKEKQFKAQVSRRQRGERERVREGLTADALAERM